MSGVGLVYTGKIVAMEKIEGADLIACATVVCGKGGKWKGVVIKNEYYIGSLCTVYLPDCLICPSKEMKFMEKYGWRVKMRRFKGAPSEVLIMPLEVAGGDVGSDVTQLLNVKKYHKPVPASLAGVAKGEFPGFIPKTDEPNYQTVPELIEDLVRKPFFITEKADGSSTTAFKYKGQFGICSRNWEMMRDENSGYWQIAIRHKLEENLPEGIAIQWETCGPKIQSNPHGLNEVTGLAFSGYDIEGKKYLEFDEFVKLCTKLKFPMVKILMMDDCFYKDGLETLGEGTYSNGKQREGVVVRSTTNQLGHKPISFKVINLNYEK
jgi:RNA ligase (TIGR02306 family)